MYLASRPPWPDFSYLPTTTSSPGRPPPAVELCRVSSLLVEWPLHKEAVSTILLQTVALNGSFLWYHKSQKNSQENSQNFDFMLRCRYVTYSSHM